MPIHWYDSWDNIGYFTDYIGQAHAAAALPQPARLGFAAAKREHPAGLKLSRTPPLSVAEQDSRRAQRSQR